MSSHPRGERKRLQTKAIDQKEFKQFFMQHFKFVKIKAMTSCHNDIIAEQLTQDTFVRAARAFHRFDHMHPQAWLRRILKNVIIDYYNKQNREREVFAHSDFDVIEKTHQDEESVEMDIKDYESLEQAIDPEGAQVNNRVQTWGEKYLTDEVKESLEALSEDHRNILIAREILGYNYSDIGDLFDIKEGTVMSRLSRARTALKLQLQEVRARQ
jgi:RNA polymerase sigma-70 factor (ECF subfamily)